LPGFPDDGIGARETSGFATGEGIAVGAAGEVATVMDLEGGASCDGLLHRGRGREGGRRAERFVKELHR